MRYIPGDEIFTKKLKTILQPLTAIDILNFLHVHFKKHSWAFFLLWTYFCLLLPFMNNSTRWRSLSTNLLRFLNEMSEFHSHCSPTIYSVFIFSWNLALMNGPYIQVFANISQLETLILCQPISGLFFKWLHLHMISDLALF